MNYRQAIADYIAQEARPIEKYGHQPRLYVLTTQIGRGLQYDEDVVYAAAWLHDLGVFAGHRPEEPEQLAAWDHVRYTLDRVPAILSQAGFPEEKIPAVLDAIRTHRPEDDPTCLEGVILRDADILEQLGAVGILRTVCKIGRDTRFQTFTDAVGALRRALDRLPFQLRLPSARILAETRIQALQGFLDAVEKETRGRVW